MIHGYHEGRSSCNTARPDAKFFYVGNGRLKHVSASNAGKRLYLGVELEVDMFSGYDVAEEVSDYVDSVIGEYAICMHDGSLSRGFEIVFQPMTIKAFAMIRPLVERVMAEIDARGGRSHNSPHCGLHVHTSRVYWGNDDAARSLAFGKALEITERFQPQFSSIARRDVTQSQWCRPTGYGYAATDSSRAIRRKANRITVGQGFGCHDGRRYRVWNFQNTNTVECRAFKGTLKAETFFATLAFVDGLVRFCTKSTSTEVHEVTFDNLIAWIGNSDLTAYWSTRRSQASRYTPYAA